MRQPSERTAVTSAQGARSRGFWRFMRGLVVVEGERAQERIRARQKNIE
jgi:predicted ABC-type ATPase